MGSGEAKLTPTPAVTLPAGFSLEKQVIYKLFNICVFSFLQYNIFFFSSIFLGDTASLASSEEMPLK